MPHIPLTLDDGTPIAFDWTPCTYGGLRPWFLCPRCARRCARLVTVRGVLRCRVCLNLRYASQGADAMRRACYRAFAIRGRLGGRGSLNDPFPEKPRGMHWTTYERLREREQRAQGVWCVSAIRLLGRLRAGLP